MPSCEIRNIQFHLESSQTPTGALLYVTDILAGGIAIEIHRLHQGMTSSVSFWKVLTVLFRGAGEILAVK